MAKTHGLIKMKPIPSERGNALIMILIAIALIATLTMAVMRSDSTDADSISPEQAAVLASQILTQARNLEQGVVMLQSKGCGEQQISFKNDVVTGYTNASAPVDESCELFKQTGVGQAWPLPPTNANDGSPWRMLGGNAVGGLTLTDDGTCASKCIDPMAVLPNVTLAVCQQINKMANRLAASDTPPVDAGNIDGTTKLAGFDGAAVGVPLLDASDVLKGKRTGCFQPTNIDAVAAPAGTYWFYHVLIVR